MPSPVLPKGFLHTLLVTHSILARVYATVTAIGLILHIKKLRRKEAKDFPLCNTDS